MICLFSIPIYDDDDVAGDDDNDDTTQVVATPVNPSFLILGVTRWPMMKITAMMMMMIDKLARLTLICDSLIGGRQCCLACYDIAVERGPL